MKIKKVIGIILAVLFGGLFCGGIFALIFFMSQSRGYSLDISILLGFCPFIGTVIIVGIILFILHLLED